MRFFHSRHSVIGTIIVCIAICVIVIVAAMNTPSSQDEKMVVEQDVWSSCSKSTQSYSSCGYAVLFESLQQLYGVSIHLLPWTPDRNPERESAATDYFLIINSPERKWNKTEAASLAAFVHMGGTAFVSLYSFDSLDNIKELFAAVDINYVTRHAAEKADLYKDAYTLTFAYDNSFDNEIYFKISPTRTHGIFRSKRFKTLVADAEENPVLTVLESGKGKIYFLNALLPGFNGEYRAMNFSANIYESYLNRLLTLEGFDRLKEAAKAVMSEYTMSKQDEAVEINTGSVEEINSGLAALDTLFSEATASGRKLVFFDYLGDAQTQAGFLSIISSGAFYALLLAAAFLVAGFIFFVRDPVPVDVLREKRLISLHAVSGSVADPAVLRQAKTRFAAQYIQISKMLKKNRGK